MLLLAFCFNIYFHIFDSTHFLNVSVSSFSSFDCLISNLSLFSWIYTDVLICMLLLRAVSLQKRPQRQFSEMSDVLLIFWSIFFFKIFQVARMWIILHQPWSIYSLMANKMCSNQSSIKHGAQKPVLVLRYLYTYWFFSEHRNRIKKCVWIKRKPFELFVLV